MKLHTGWEIALDKSLVHRAPGPGGVYKFDLRPLADFDEGATAMDKWLLKLSLRSAKSRSVVFEDGRPLKSDRKIASSPESAAPGKYLKSGRTLYLTTGDGADPRAHVYQIRLSRIIAVRHLLPL
ncbi:MAG: hypothetical protein LBV70_07125, partial [Candidatus Adiutrix sp.]|nr:hypothetical protein [Candidatus Adiutrix sp.]